MSTKNKIIQFGKHQGKSIEDIPHDYLLWLRNSTEETLEMCEEELERRDKIVNKQHSIDRNKDNFIDDDDVPF